jgi:hypothetical protein
MLKYIAAVIVSYLVMAIFLFAVFTAAYLALGPERVFQPGTYAVSTLWLTFYAPSSNPCLDALTQPVCLRSWRPVRLMPEAARGIDSTQRLTGRRSQRLSALRSNFVVITIFYSQPRALSSAVADLGSR